MSGDSDEAPRTLALPALEATARDDDLRVLDTLLARLEALARHAAPAPPEIGPLALAFRDAQGLGHRVVLVSVELLLTRSDLEATLVVGERSGPPRPAPRHATTAEVVDALWGRPEIATFSSKDLPEGGRAALLLRRAATDARRIAPEHPPFCDDIKPGAFGLRRVYRARLMGGLSGSLELESVRERKPAA